MNIIIYKFRGVYLIVTTFQILSFPPLHNSVQQFMANLQYLFFDSESLVFQYRVITTAQVTVLFRQC